MTPEEKKAHEELVGLVSEIASIVMRIKGRVDTLEVQAQAIALKLDAYREDLDYLADVVREHATSLQGDDRVFTLLLAGGGLGQ